MERLLKETPEDQKEKLSQREWSVKDTKQVIDAMIEDVLREGEGEFIDNQESRKEIGKRAALLFVGRYKER
jgi:hypothetical protein